MFEMLTIFFKVLAKVQFATKGMFRSNETFAGATQLDGNSVFGMILNESKGSNADGPETFSIVFCCVRSS